MTHHEINSCQEAVFNHLYRRKTQLDALRAGDEEVLSALEQEGEICCEGEDYNVDPAIAIQNLDRAILRLETLEARLAEFLTYCERCGKKDGAVRPVYPDTRWLCGDCYEA